MGDFSDDFDSSAFLLEDDAPPPPAVVVTAQSRAPRRGRTLKRGRIRYVERWIETPDGPLRVMVPDPFNTDDLLVLVAEFLE